MRKFVAATILAAALALPAAAPAFAEGSRQAAGGGFMSTYVADPYHDPRSLRSQRAGTGQILGAPMFSEGAGAHAVRRDLVEPHWATGSIGRRAR